MRSYSFTLIFDNYVASIGPGVAVTENRKNCQINLNLAYPAGFQYSVFNTIYRGYIGIDSGVSARQEATFYFSGGKSPPPHPTNSPCYLIRSQTDAHIRIRTIQHRNQLQRPKKWRLRHHRLSSTQLSCVVPMRFLFRPQYQLSSSSFYV